MAPARTFGQAPWPRRFVKFVRAGGGIPGVWRLIAGLGVVVAVWMAVTVALFALSDPPGLLEAAATPRGVATILLTFGGLWLGVWAAMALCHRQRLVALLAAGRHWPEAALRGLGLGIGAYGAVLAAGFLVGVRPGRTGLDLADWIAWSPVLLCLIAVQSGAEELLFRGYLAQQLARLGRIGRHPAVWAGVPALVFAAMHMAPGLPGDIALLYGLVTLLFGLTAAALVWRTGGLAAAMGMHAGFNLGGLTLVGVEGLLPGAQLWNAPAEDIQRLLVIDAVAMAALLALVASRAGRRLDEPARA